MVTQYEDEGGGAMYPCPFCDIEVEDTIEALNKHREPNGECDREMDAR